MEEEEEQPTEETANLCLMANTDEKEDDEKVELIFAGWSEGEQHMVSR